MICTTCGEIDSAQFYVRKSGRTPKICKKCEKTKSKIRHSEKYSDPDAKNQILQKNAFWKKMNFDKVSAYNKEYSRKKHVSSSSLSEEDAWVAEIRSHGYLPPFWETPSEVFTKLQKTPLLQKLVQSNVGLNYLDSLFSHRFDSSTEKHPSFKDAFFDDMRLKKVFAYLVDNGIDPTYRATTNNLRYSVRMPSHFFPSAVASILQSFAAGKRVFDPFAGWGGRCLGALCSEVASYTATDLQKESISGCQRMVSDFANVRKMVGSFHHSDAVDFTSKTDQTFDFVITSPPFFDTETYGGGKSEDWISDLMVPLIRNLKRIIDPNGLIAFHVQDRPNVPVRSVCTSIFLSIGFSIDREFQYGKTKGQSVLLLKRSA